MNTCSFNMYRVVVESLQIHKLCSFIVLHVYTKSQNLKLMFIGNLENSKNYIITKSCKYFVCIICTVKFWNAAF